jgi:choline dehydrogenase-like flavoprotein
MSTRRPLPGSGDCPLPDFHPDVVILGGGLAGSVVALELVRLDSEVKVLLLEAGTVAVDDHGQSILAGPGLYDDLLAERWDTTSEFAPKGIVETLGGSSVAWSGWSPRPRPSELAAWPADVVDGLEGGLLAEAEEWLGVSGRHSTNELAAGLAAVFTRAADSGELPYITPSRWLAPISLAPDGHVFSPLPRLQEAARKHADRLRVRTGRRVLSLAVQDGRVSSVATDQGEIPVGDGTSVVLALGTVESARQVLLACPELEPVGSAIAAHVLSDLTLRVPVDTPQQEFQWAALLLPGQAGGNHFHVQVHAGVGPVPQDRTAFLRKEIPGLYGEELLAGTDERHMVVSLVALGELAVDEAADNSVVLAKHHRDPFGIPSALLSIAPSAENARVLDAMDDMLDALCARLTRPGAQYRSDTDGPDEWHDDVPARHSTNGGRRWDRCVHESGSLRMAEDPGHGPTDADGAVRGLSNLYATGLALFPRTGSHNGGLTATALALRLARRLAARPRTARSARTGPGCPS